MEPPLHTHEHSYRAATFSANNSTIFILILAVLFNFFEYSQGSSLNRYIRYFEPVYFNTSDLSRQLHIRRSKRSLHPAQETINLDFRAHNRLFRLRLKEAGDRVFSSDVTFENSEGEIPFSQRKVLSGSLEDDSLASVDGVLTEDGHFDGHIQTRDGLFYIEPANRYFPGSPDFPAVIYSSEDVNHPSLRTLDGVFQHSCESHHLLLKTRERWMRPGHHNHSHRDHHNGQGDKIESLPESQHFHDGILTVGERTRSKSGWMKSKRASGDYYDKRKTTCMLYLQADHLFYEKMGRSEEACIEVMTRHVQRVNSIYRAVDFDMDGSPDNISFMIKRIKVHTGDALEDPSYRFPGNYGVEKFLEIFSEENYDQFCLAYMFTYRDFEGGTLGLAWTGDLKNAGGVCEKNGHYRGSYKSLNTGIITLMNYGKHVPPAVSHVTMAHEMGHNFGSPHDPENDANCVPGGEDGNFIMFARATSGDKINNKRFSPCSLRSIHEVLTAKARGPKGCFTEPEIAICGNGVVEEGEECDCGWDDDCTEACCWPQRTEFSPAQRPCTLKRGAGAVCSPSQGPCCNRDCSHNVGAQCREDNGCRADSFCDGSGVQCPPSVLKPNKTVCNQEFVCFQGECTGSICLAYGLESCQCSQEEGDSDTKPCELCCKLPGDPLAPCISSFQWQVPPHDVPDMYSKAGTPCNNYQGYCDVFQKCREVDPLGPLLTLRELLFSDNSIMTLTSFVTKYWYSLILAAIAVIALMVTIIKLCGKKTPLVHHRRHRRRKTLRHMNDLDPNLEPGPSDVHVHATAVKSDITTHKSKHKEDKRKRSKDRDQKPKPPASSKKVTQPQDYDSAQKLATKLTAKLMSVLPPEPGPDKYQRVDTEAGAERGRDKSRETRIRERKSASPDKRDNGDGRQQRIKKTARSKSEIIPPNNVRELIDEQQEHANNGMTSSKDKNQQQPKEVTIAKLGPFKMSLEVKNNEKQGVAASGETKTKDRKSRQSKGPEEVKKASTLEKEKSSSSQNDKRKRSRSKSAYSKSKDENKKSEVRKEPEASKRPETNFDEIKTEAEYLKYENQISSESKKKKKMNKEKIVVSKLAKSDRPVREKSPEKVVKADNSKNVASSLTDHSLEVKYKPDVASSSKFSRSISQPAPPPEFDKLLLSTDSQIGLKRNLSLIMDEKEKQPRLKRSSTARDDFSNSGNQKHSRSKLVEQLTESSGQGSRSDKMSLYDNYGFDSSPDLGQTANNEKRQQTLLHLKDTIKSQLMIAGAETSSTNVKDKQRKLKDAFFPSLKMADEDSDTSDEANRDSPPTQIQSLSEESSGGSTRRRKTGQSSSPASIRFDSSDDSEAGDEAVGAHGPDPGAVLSLGLVHNSSTAALLHSTEEEDSEEDEFSTVPVSASNPHVKLPVHGFPVPVPRTSLQTQAKDVSDNGCDSDSTIDIRIRKSEYSRRNSPCPVANQEVDEDWEVREDSSDNDDITDIDTTSIITDSLAQQMMY